MAKQRRNAKLPVFDVDQLTACRLCPRLVAWREEVSLRKRAAYLDEPYWGAPVPPFGEVTAKLLLLGLAPGAHGANRTGRMFSGDSSAHFLVAALHRCGLSNQASSLRRGDGLQLHQTRMTCAVRCVPPDNKPTRDEIQTCRHWLSQELGVLSSLKVIVALGALAWEAALAVTTGRDEGGREPTTAAFLAPAPPRSNAAQAPRSGPSLAKPRFAHGAVVQRGGEHGPLLLLGSYHPSQQNTFTGRLTPSMLEGVLENAKRLSALSAS